MQRKKQCLGTIIVVGIACSWVLSTQLSGKIQTSEHFNAPFFLMWFSTNWIILTLFFPIVCRLNIKEEMKKEKLSFKRLAVSAFIFYLLWGGANYLYTWALAFTSPSIVTAVFSSAPAFVFLLSLWILRQQFTFLKFLAVLFCIGGVVLIASSQGIGGASFKGIIFSLCSAICAALYKVNLKFAIGDAGLATTSIYLCLLGTINLVLFWPVWLILSDTGVEVITVAQIPWKWMCLSALGGFLFNGLINFGIAYTYPLFISIGTVLGIPLSIIVDKFINNSSITVFQIVGSVCVIAGFILLFIASTGRKKETKSTIYDDLVSIDQDNLLVRKNSSEKI